MSELLTDFLGSLNEITAEELVHELEKAKEDTVNSYLMDSENDELTQ
jgi:hypothetical protein